MSQNLLPADTFGLFEVSEFDASFTGPSSAATRIVDVDGSRISLAIINTSSLRVTVAPRSSIASNAEGYLLAENGGRLELVHRNFPGLVGSAWYAFSSDPGSFTLHAVAVSLRRRYGG